MPTCTALMRFNEYVRKCAMNAKMNKSDNSLTHSLIHPSSNLRFQGFTMAELVVVILMVSLFVLLAQIHLFGLLRKNTFKAQAHELVSTMQMAASAAAESNRRYEFIIDPTQQTYILREITSPDLSQVLEEEIIVENNFSDSCRVVYIEFDDGDYINDGWAKFRAGHAGWQYGGKIVLLDETEQPYSVVVNRINRIVSLKKGDIALLATKAKEEMAAVIAAKNKLRLQKLNSNGQIK